MDLNAWLKEFRALHDEKKRGSLTGGCLSGYYAARDELARALLAAQRIAVEPGQQPRRTLRVSLALQVDVAFFDGSVRVLTRSISSGGFAALFARAPKVDDEVKVTLRVPGSDSLQSSARVVEIRSQSGSAHVSFRWVGLPDSDIERLETLVFDTALKQLES